jgi:hypothetical protein
MDDDQVYSTKYDSLASFTRDILIDHESDGPLIDHVSDQTLD